MAKEQPGNSATPKAIWSQGIWSGPPNRDALARIVAQGGGRDEAENSYFELTNNPQFVKNETARRRFKSQLRRRLRNRASRARQSSA